MLNVTRSFLDSKVISRLAAVPLIPRFAMQGTVSGKHTSPHRGSSIEFAEYRKYVPGDDIRRLDWRAFGRTDRYYVKEFEADTNLRLCVVLDTSGSMGFSSKGMPTKIDYARRIAATLGYLAAQQGDAVGLTTVAEKIIQSIPAKRSAAHLKLILDTLEQAKPQGETLLPAILDELAERLRQRALVVIVSDFFVAPEELKRCFEHLRFRKHDVAAFHLLDPQEIEFAFGRPVRFVDMEGNTSVFVEPTEIADRYQTALQKYLAAIQKIVLETGLDYHRVQTSESYEQPLMRFLVGRTRARGVR
jgi:uncharacterized protein (DUF58 family)